MTSPASISSGWEYVTYCNSPESSTPNAKSLPLRRKGDGAQHDDLSIPASPSFSHETKCRPDRASCLAKHVTKDTDLTTTSDMNWDSFLLPPDINDLFSDAGDDAFWFADKHGPPPGTDDSGGKVLPCASQAPSNQEQAIAESTLPTLVPEKSVTDPESFDAFWGGISLDAASTAQPTTQEPFTSAEVLNDPNLGPWDYQAFSHYASDTDAQQTAAGASSAGAAEAPSSIAGTLDISRVHGTHTSRSVCKFVPDIWLC